MYIFGKRADQLTANDIKQLVDNKFKKRDTLTTRKNSNFHSDN